MRQKLTGSVISARSIKFQIAAIACIIPLYGAHSTAWADGFQRIRTFDPNKGLVAGNGGGIPITPQTYNAPSNWATQQPPGQSGSSSNQNSSMVTRDYGQQASAKPAGSGSDEELEDSRDSKHHKHHHKFLIFGHGGNENQPRDSDRSDQPTNRMATDRAPDIQQNNKLYIPISPGYAGADPVNTGVSAPIISPRMPSSVIPPDPRQRPSSPAIDQNARLPIVQNAGAKPSLAWRTRAWKLASEPDDSGSANRHPSKILNCSTDEALTTAATCCRAKGAQIVGQSLPAGQLGVRFSDNSGNRSFIVFVAKSIGNNRTLLKASADSDRAQKVSLANDLIQQVGVIIDGKGLL